MASKQKGKQKANAQFDGVRRYTSGLSLLAVVIVAMAGIMNGVRMTQIVYRCGLVCVVIVLLGALVLKMMAGYGEINSG